MSFCDAAPRRALSAAAAGLLALAAELGAGAAAAADAEPFRTRNLSPLVSIFGVPAWETPVRGTRAAFTAEIANHYRLSRRGGETLILDGETVRAAAVLRRELGERWSAGIELPYLRQSGGVLDDVIDGWHSFFNLPDGGRNARAEGRLAYLMADRGGPFYALRGSGGGPGDVLLSLGRRLGGDDGLFVKGTLKLPTGDEALLAGSGAADFAVTAVRAARASFMSRPAGYFWGAGAVLLGEPELIAFSARRAVGLGMLGGSFRPWPRIGLKAQLDVHGPLYDSPLDELGEPGIQATLGGWWELNERAVVEVAVNEDLAVSTSPDVVLHMALKWTL